MCAFCIPEASTRRLRRAVPKIPSKSSVPPRLPLHKDRALLTPSKSTLLQLLIPLHFISRRMNVYKKPGRGPLLPAQQFCKLVTTHKRTNSTRWCARIPIPFIAFRTLSVTQGGGCACLLPISSSASHSSVRASFEFRISHPHFHGPLDLLGPFFSQSYALYGAAPKIIFNLFSIFRILSIKHPGDGYPSQAQPSLSVPHSSAVSNQRSTVSLPLLPSPPRPGAVHA